VQKTIWHRRSIPQITPVFLFVAAASLATAAASKSQTFSLPESILLFGNYEDLRVVTRDGDLKLRPPIDVGYNGGYFAFPGISPRGDAVAWGFAVAWQESQKQNRARFALGVYSLLHQQWKTFGDFDGIGIAAYSSDGSRIAVVADTNGGRQLLIFDVAKETWTVAPYPTGGLRRQTTMGWSPDNKRLVVEIQRGGMPYSPQMSKADADRNPAIAILDIDSGNVQKLGEGFNPTWSPDGQWIAYFEPSGASCLVVHPDGTGLRVVKRFKRSPFFFIAETSFEWGGPVWSPDSKQMLFTTSASEPYVDVRLLDLPTGRTTTKLKKALPIYGWVASPGSHRNHDGRRNALDIAPVPSQR
jgi:hypothetical protein